MPRHAFRKPEESEINYESPEFVDRYSKLTNALFALTPVVFFAIGKAVPGELFELPDFVRTATSALLLLIAGYTVGNPYNGRTNLIGEAIAFTSGFVAPASDMTPERFAVLTATTITGMLVAKFKERPKEQNLNNHEH